MCALARCFASRVGLRQNGGFSLHKWSNLASGAGPGCGHRLILIVPPGTCQSLKPPVRIRVNAGDFIFGEVAGGRWEVLLIWVRPLPAKGYAAEYLVASALLSGVSAFGADRGATRVLGPAGAHSAPARHRSAGARGAAKGMRSCPAGIGRTPEAVSSRRQRSPRVYQVRDAAKIDWIELSIASSNWAAALNDIFSGVSGGYLS